MSEDRTVRCFKRMRIWLILALLVFLVTSLNLSGVAGQTTTISNVAYVHNALFDIDSRTSIPPLIVNATVGYSDAQPSDYLAVGIFDLDDGNLVSGLGSSTPQPCTSTARFAGCIIPLTNAQGIENMQFSLDYPQSEWNLDLEAALLDKALDPVANSFSGYTFTMKVQSALTLSVIVPGNAPVNVDGVNGSGGTIQLVLAAGNHTVAVPEFIPVNNVTRLKFSSWSDGVTATERIVDLNHDVTLSGSYVTQYRLEVVSQVNVSGTGWYDAGTAVRLSVQSSTERMTGIIGILGGRWVFQGWDVNSLEISQSSTAHVTMNSARVVTVQWSPDYSVPMVILGLLVLLSITTAYVSRTVVNRQKTEGRPKRRRRPSRSRSHPRSRSRH